MVALDSDMPSATRALTSWKEIAHHLGVNVRTAQKWERDRSLPVQRVSGARSRVSANIAELDVWKKQLTEPSRNEERCYRWPLGPGVTVEVRFFGRDLSVGQVEVLREYLEVVKTALSSTTR